VTGGARRRREQPRAQRRLVDEPWQGQDDGDQRCDEDAEEDEKSAQSPFRCFGGRLEGEL
jgi:hypothetical protein